MKTINLDLYKIDGMTKAFTSRVADTGGGTYSRA